MLHAALHAGSDDDIAAAESLPGFWERYRYNIRFSKDQLDRDIPPGIFAAQGVGGVWYGGGALSHWNIADILWQSSQVVERMARDTGPRSKKHRWAFVPVAQRVTERKISTALSKAFLGTAVPEYFYGTYNFVGHPLMVSAVVSRVEGDEAAVMASLPKHYLGGGEVVGVGVIRKKDIVPSPLAWQWWRGSWTRKATTWRYTVEALYDFTLLLKAITAKEFSCSFTAKVRPTRR